MIAAGRNQSVRGSLLGGMIAAAGRKTRKDKSVCKVSKNQDTAVFLNKRAEKEIQMSMYERGLTTS